MAARRIRRSMLVAGACVFALWLTPGTAGASGGGGCGTPVTDATGTGVEIDQFCFSPTILRTQPGSVVTFENLDPVTHNVLGAHGAWGTWDALKRGRDLAFRFVEPGVFPYVCAYHPGMVGVVVVGNGIGGAIDSTTAEGPIVQVSAQQAAALNANASAASEPAVVAEPASVAATSGADRSTSWPAAALALAGVGIVSVGTTAVGLRRSRRRSPS